MIQARTMCALACGLLMAAAALPMPGCSSGKILRENVLASTQSTFGLHIAQNPQTQVHEFKFGYARNELFLVPTDKTITYAESGSAGKKEKSVSSGATKTANVVGEIQVGGTARGTENGVRMYQRLAVGDIAVRSGAAIALYAEDKDVAKAASAASKLLTLEDEAPEKRADRANRLLYNAYLDADKYATGSPEKLLADKVDLARHDFPVQNDFPIYTKTGDDSFEVAGPDGKHLGDNFLRVTSYLQELRKSIEIAETIVFRARKDPQFSLLDKRYKPSKTASSIDAETQRQVAGDIAKMRQKLRNTLTKLSETEEVMDLLEWYIGGTFGL